MRLLLAFCIGSNWLLTLTVKKSRPIKIDGEDYRYTILTTRVDNDWNFTLNITVQKWNPPRGILEVKGLVTRDFWLDISDGAKWNIGDYPVVLPRHILHLVELAISLGWERATVGKPYRLNTNNGAVFNQT